MTIILTQALAEYAYAKDTEKNYADITCRKRE